MTTGEEPKEAPVIISPSFKFVRITKPGHGWKNHNEHIVRSHAMRQVRKRQKLEKKKDPSRQGVLESSSSSLAEQQKQKKPDNRSANKAAPPFQRGQRNVLTPAGSESFTNTVENAASTSTASSALLPVRTRISGSHTGKKTRGSHHGTSPVLTRSSKTLDRPDLAPSGSLYSISSMDARTLDPFQTYPSKFPPTVVNWCISYCLSVLWPGLMPSSNRERKNMSVLSWFELSRHDSTLFTLFLYCAISHQRLRQLTGSITGDVSGAAPSKEILRISELESIKEVNKEIQTPSRAVSDGIILSVASLANHTGDELIWEVKQSPFQPPLQSLQWLDIYGSLLPNHVHLNGLGQLIKLKEGPKKTTLRGLAPILSYSDILVATKVLSYPQLPFIPLEGDINSQPTLQSYLGFSSTDLEHGFMRLCKIGFTADLAEVFQAMKAYISVLETFQEEQYSTTEPDMCRISNQRNLVQFHLLSLPPAGEFDENFRQSYPVYEACRLAGLIFAVGVTFPLPVQRAPFIPLVERLQAELQASELESTWSSRGAVRVLVWVLMMGGIAATGRPERAWFVATLHRVTVSSGVSGWRELKLALESMLWLNSACDRAGKQLWDEFNEKL